MLKILLTVFVIASSELVFAASPNIILITVDTTRADRMGFLGSQLGLTPNLDALAAHSLIFARAYAQVPLTTPSHAALLTGTYPQFNHVEDLGSPLPKQIPYLPDLLHQHGYRTAAFVGAEILNPASTAPGFERGFDVYDADFHRRKPGEDRYHSLERRAEDVANRALGWLSHNQKAPFFIWIHFYDPHDPYDPPEPFKSRYLASPYDGEIAYTDSVIGSFINVLQKHGLYQSSIIAVASDHGEAFGEHGEQRHGVFLYDETIHVPLLLKLPSDRFAGQRIQRKVALTSIAPTLLEAANIAVPPSMQARSLLHLVQGSANGKKTEDVESPVYSETNYSHRTFGWAVLRSWRTDKYLYVQAPKRELYDESSDPGATKNLVDTAKAVTGTLNTQLDDFFQKTAQVESESTKLDPSQVEKLRSLGYLASDSGGPADATHSTVDPKDKIAVADKFHESLLDMGEDRDEDAIAELREVIRMEPEMGSAYLELGRALIRDHQEKEALPVLKTAAAKLPDSGIAHYELALLLIKDRQWEPALVEMQAAAVSTPQSALFHFNVAALETRINRVNDAIPEFKKALEISPDYFEANLTFGRLLLLQKRPELAAEKLKRAVKTRPDSADAHRALATAYHQLGLTKDEDRELGKANELKGEKTD
jgi:arylsulfatase A-like enzyme/Flp pilus assembly protein TadD